MERLTEYETFEFDGDVIAAPKYNRTRLGTDDLKDWAYRAAAKLAEYEDAEEEGKLLNLLFAPGDTAYYVSELAPGIPECTVESITVSKNMTLICIKEKGRAPHYINAERIGRNLFKTREEAEKTKEKH